MLVTASRNLPSIFVAVLCFAAIANTQDTQYDDKSTPEVSSENPLASSSSWDDFWAKLQEFLHVKEGTKSEPLLDDTATEDVLFTSKTRRSSTAAIEGFLNSSSDVIGHRVDTTGTDTSHTAETAGIKLANGLSSANWTLALDSIPRRFNGSSSTHGQSSQNESREIVDAATASSSEQPVGALQNKTGDESTITQRNYPIQAGPDDTASVAFNATKPGPGQEFHLASPYASPAESHLPSDDWNKSAQSVAEVSPRVTSQPGAVTENSRETGIISTTASPSMESVMDSASQHGLWSDQKMGPTSAGDQVGKSPSGSLPALDQDGGLESLNSAPYKVSDDYNDFKDIDQDLMDNKNKGISARPLNLTTLDCDWMNQSGENAFVRMIDRICRVLKPLPLVYHIVILLTLGLLSIVVCLVSVKCLCGRNKKKENNEIRTKDSAIERGTRKEKRALLEV